MRVTSASLGVGGGEDGVDKDEGADDLSAEAGSFGVARSDGVGSAAEGLVGGRLEAFDNTGAADGSEALHDHVEDSSGQ